MSVTRFSLSIDRELAAEMRANAEATGESTSAWVAEASRRRIQQDNLLAVVSDWESQNGAISPQELSRANRRLGLTSAKRPGRA